MDTCYPLWKLLSSILNLRENLVGGVLRFRQKPCLRKNCRHVSEIPGSECIVEFTQGSLGNAFERFTRLCVNVRAWLSTSLWVNPQVSPVLISVVNADPNLNPFSTVAIILGNNASKIS